MRKAIRIISIFCLFFLAACTFEPTVNEPAKEEKNEKPDFTTDEYIPGYDVPKSMNSQVNLWLPYLETQDAFYFVGDPSNYIRYYDKTTGKLDYLCSKPECQHNDDKCGAYCLGAGVNSGAYNEELFISGVYRDPVSPHAVHACTYVMNPDGSDRSIWRDSQNDVDFIRPVSSGASRSFYHRGFVYTVGCVKTLEDGNVPEYYCRVYAQAADAPYSDTALVFEYKLTNATGTEHVRFLGHSIYYLTSEVVEGTNRQLRLFLIDTITWDSQLIAQCQTTNNAYDLWIENDGTVYASLWNEEQKMLALYKVDNGEFYKVFETNGGVKIAEGLTLSLINKNEDNRSVIISMHNLQGDIIYEGPLYIKTLAEKLGDGVFETKAHISFAHAFCEDGKLYVVFFHFGLNHNYSLISYDLSPDGPENETLIWIQGM